MRNQITRRWRRGPEQLYALVRVTQDGETMIEAELQPAQAVEENGLRVEVLWIRKHYPPRSAPSE